MGAEPQCFNRLSLGGGDAPFLDIMTVQDLRLEIRRDGTATAATRGAKAAGAGCCTAGAN
jgi:hypothetical protein